MPCSSMVFSTTGQNTYSAGALEEVDEAMEVDVGVEELSDVAYLSAVPVAYHVWAYNYWRQTRSGSTTPLR